MRRRKSTIKGLDLGTERNKHGRSIVTVPPINWTRTEEPFFLSQCFIFLLVISEKVRG